MSTGIVSEADQKLEEDFLFYIEHFKGAFDGLKSDCEKEICEKWLDKLAVETYKSTLEKQARNIYLAQLIMSMSERKLSAPFNCAPKLGPLSLEGVFKHITSKPDEEKEKEKEINENKEKWSQFVRNRELEIEDLNHVSNDGRTYVACKNLASNCGMFAYVAVTMGGSNKDCGWVNTCGQPIPSPVVKPLDLKVKTPVPANNCTQEDDKAFQITTEVRMVLAKRKTPEARMLTYEFFKRVYDSIEQEMLSEVDPNSTACHDPYVESLLDKLIIDSKACNKFDPRLFKRIKMLSMLKKRVSTILQDIEMRNALLAEMEVSSTSPILSLTSPSSSCTNSMSEMMWQGALMEKPTTKMADALAKTYPVCVVKMLLALLARERRKIIMALQEKQEKIIFAMKKDLLNEIKRGIMSYKANRKEWVDVMRVVMHYNKMKEMLTEKDLGGNLNNTKGDYLQDTIRKEIEDTKKRLQKTNINIEKLQDDICELNKHLHDTTEKIEIEQVQNAECLRNLQMEICDEKTQIVTRAQTIDELERMLKELEK